MDVVLSGPHPKRGAMMMKFIAAKKSIGLFESYSLYIRSKRSQHFGEDDQICIMKHMALQYKHNK